MVWPLGFLSEVSGPLSTHPEQHYRRPGCVVCPQSTVTWGVLSLPQKQDNSRGFAEPEGTVCRSRQRWLGATPVEAKHWLARQLVLPENAALGLCEPRLLSLPHIRVENIPVERAGSNEVPSRQTPLSS